MHFSTTKAIFTRNIIYASYYWSNLNFKSWLVCFTSFFHFSSLFLFHYLASLSLSLLSICIYIHNIYIYLLSPHSLFLYNRPNPFCFFPLFAARVRACVSACGSVNELVNAPTRTRRSFSVVSVRALCRHRKTRLSRRVVTWNVFSANKIQKEKLNTYIKKEKVKIRKKKLLGKERERTSW